ncbi:hypothetical protein [Brevibacterium sandarakinum]|nr:hypothetical protein [Brevibacterium sandarakinum]
MARRSPASVVANASVVAWIQQHRALELIKDTVSSEFTKLS